MTLNQTLDIIWNISLICPWDCDFCCTDAVHITTNNRDIIAREHSLSSTTLIEKSTESEFRRRYPGIKPTKYDLALIARQSAGKELSFDQKIAILKNLSGRRLKIDFAGGDPLACYENYLVIKKASEIFGKESISITSTGTFIKRYGAEKLANIIGEFEFTYDEPSRTPQHSRPSGYNSSNLKFAELFSALGVRTKAQLPIHLGNLSDSKTKEIYLDLCKAGVDELLLMRTFPVGRGESYLNRNPISRSQIVECISNFKEIEDKSKTSIRLQCALKFLSNERPERNPCDLMHESFGINFMGDLLLSAWANNNKGLPLSNDFILGNLCKQSFEEISLTDKFQRYKKRLDENFGHCKIFSYIHSDLKTENALFELTDPLFTSES
ncbi:radical SAM/SPASM domain-containing protein [Pseudomonas kurunegalensis]|uniref:radical SAM/SPASM domain-containing protein n=1 Tax=Pseudomonas kurunegalensis TaxID=485880 RepID=UPI002363CCD9|nr:hypothetical protein [Pseudomonas kurunegalensis]MDD2136768.1 hypothetical protein [Pseudomonas kurunegalensis]